MRKQAQEVLAELLDLQFALQAHGVEKWAPAPFAEVKAVAADADALYKNRQYEQAVARYQQGLAALQALQDAMPQELKRLLEQAQQAIDGGDATAASAALQLAALIAPDNGDIAKLQHRADVLPQLLPLLQAAATAEAAGDLARRNNCCSRRRHWIHCTSARRANCSASPQNRASRALTRP